VAGRQFKITDHRGQQVVEIMGNPARHLADDFHLLRLLQGRLRLPALFDLLMELLIGLL
jgi:hypothetical protein